MNDDLIKKIFQQDSETKKTIFNLLRRDVRIHPLEEEFNCSAEIILEAISRSSDLTKRGVRGIIAEATFKYSVIDNIENWVDITPDGDAPYDFKIKDDFGDVSIQVKMQRQKAHRPMTAKEGYSFLSSDFYVVETQRTRGGKDPQTGKDTRPYHFGEFDLIAVSMAPCTNLWEEFRYTVANWLLPRKEDSQLLLKFQPVSLEPNEYWTNNLVECIKWFRSGLKKTIPIA